jgi:hypothetical protein
MRIDSHITTAIPKERLPSILKTSCAVRLFLLLLLLPLPAVVQAQFTYTTNNGAITITGYTGSGGTVTIPSATNGLPVTLIGDYAFQNCASLTSVIIPNPVTRIGNAAFFSCANLTRAVIPASVISIGNFAFEFCISLTDVYFAGNAPSLGATVFGYTIFPGSYDTNATIYYLPGTTGWGASFGDIPTVLWNPQVQTGDGSFGVQANQFGFNITGTAGLVIVVEACTNPANSSWLPVGTNTLTAGSSYFGDEQWMNYPARFYRLRSP